LRARNVPAAERARLAEEAAATLQLTELMNRKPAQISGGQRQRVALARAIVRHPKAFLMDEPLSNLDARLRVEMRAELSDLHRRTGTTVVYVTHDQVEAMTMGDRIAILDKGELRQLGTPQDVHDRPADTFVAGFVGSPPMNLMAAEVTALAGAGALAAVPGGTLPIGRFEPGKKVVVGLRPEQLVLSDEGSLPATVSIVEALGHERHVVCRLADGSLVIVRQAASGKPPALGQQVALAPAPGAAARVFDAATGKRIDGS
jgi:multiple sugar transport system ATP-binding protein